MMGLFYLGAALGAGVGGQLARLVGVLPLWTYLAGFAAVAAVTAVLLPRDYEAKSRGQAGTERLAPGRGTARI